MTNLQQALMEANIEDRDDCPFNIRCPNYSVCCRDEYYECLDFQFYRGVE